MGRNGGSCDLHRLVPLGAADLSNDTVAAKALHDAYFDA